RQRDADLPFLFVSNVRGEDAAVAAMRTGAHDYILKANLQRLPPSVERQLREAAARRERRRVEQRLVHLAYHDALTDLPNRLLMQDRLTQATRVAHREGSTVALLMLDLNGFNAINDTLGHHASHLVPHILASRIRCNAHRRLLAEPRPEDAPPPVADLRATPRSRRSAIFRRVPADAPPAIERRRRRRGARAVEPPEARPPAARRLHRSRRTDGPDQ